MEAEKGDRLPAAERKRLKKETGAGAKSVAKESFKGRVASSGATTWKGSEM
jgi:hypothetical protein